MLHLAMLPGFPPCINQVFSGSFREHFATLDNMLSPMPILRVSSSSDVSRGASDMSI
jgi:hypothetical protein